MRLRLSSIAERFRASLFLVPMIAVFIAIAVAAAGLVIDRRIDSGSRQLPLELTSTVESARALLSLVAGATITFAAIAFSISLLLIQQASSQYSPRVLHTFFRDRFNKLVMGLVVGTFTYCLIVLRSVRAAVEKTGAPIIPNLCVVIAVLLGIASILAIVAFINHCAHSMDVSEILENVEREAVTHIRREWAPTQGHERTHEDVATSRDPACTVRFDRTGWVQQVDPDALLRCIGDGTIMWLDALPGRYAIEGASLCTLSVLPGDLDQTEREICAAVSTGSTRTMQQDVSFGLRQLADVALRALSPGINDPTTAQDSVFHLAAVLAELLRRDPPPRVRTDDNGRRLVFVQQLTHDDLVHLAFDEIRRAAATQPTVCLYLLEALKVLKEPLDAVGLTDRAATLTEQARLVVAGCEAADNLPADLEHVRQVFATGFSRAH
jgi:uncharacterized membrane protein